jgi:hypothetical protein
MTPNKVQVVAGRTLLGVATRLGWKLWTDELQLPLEN